MITVVTIIAWNTNKKPSPIPGNKNVVQNNFLDKETTYNSNGKLENTHPHTLCWIAEMILGLSLTIVIISFTITQAKECLKINKKQEKNKKACIGRRKKIKRRDDDEN